MAVVEASLNGRIGWIVFNRPQKLNALDAEWDAIAHDSQGIVEISEKAQELGLNGAIAGFEQEG